MHALPLDLFLLYLYSFRINGIVALCVVNLLRATGSCDDEDNERKDT